MFLCISANELLLGIKMISEMYFYQNVTIWLFVSPKSFGESSIPSVRCK